MSDQRTRGAHALLETLRHAGATGQSVLESIEALLPVVFASERRRWGGRPIDAEAFVLDVAGEALRQAGELSRAAQTLFRVLDRAGELARLDQITGVGPKGLTGNEKENDS
jgi:hypothetical protein